MSRTLVAIPKGRDIPEFDRAVSDVLSDFDILWCCYYQSHVARQIIRKFFLDRDYTRLAICPDDMIVNRTGIDYLLDDLDKVDYQFICACANVDTVRYKNMLSVSVSKLTPPSNILSVDDYEFLVEGSQLHKSLLEGPQPIVVKHMGDPFPIIRRDVAQRLTFFNTSGSITAGCCEDVVMCNELYQMNIPIYCDLRSRFDHLKISDEDSTSKLQVGKKEPFTKLERAVS